jgi:Putative peptidoglycan binding domain/Lytic transglycolase
VSDRRYERQLAARSARRPQQQPAARAPRPDRVAAWAFLLGIFLVLLAATTSNGQSGGAGVMPAPDRAAGAEQLGTRYLKLGATGDDVRTLQRILRARGFGRVPVSGVFDGATDTAVRAFQQAGGLEVDGIVGPRTRPALVRLMSVRRATWYGPGLYGNRTACGSRLRRGTLGVAHRTLPCGTEVTFYHHGRFVTVAVIDRGPFRRGVSWDLTAATAQKIGLGQSSRVRSLPQPR